MNIRKMQIDIYNAQRILVLTLMDIAAADRENDEKGEAVAQATKVLNTMRNAGYMPRTFGGLAVEMGDETPEQIAEYLEALNY